jgi:hypothetical protein
MSIFKFCDRGRLSMLSALASVAALLICAAPAIALRQEPGEAAVDPAALVRNASWNELHSSGAPSPVRYKLRKQDAKGVTTKEIVETKDGEVARLIAKNDQPLTPAENQAELARLNNLLAHPEIQEHRHKREQEDSGREDELVKVLPQAFLYTYLGMVEGPNGPAYRLALKPNPNFTPPDREAEVYHGMEGELWIDKEQQRIVKVDAHLVADVNFGWGILGKLYKGGTLTTEQRDVGHRHWEPTLLKLNLTGVALMLKPLSYQMTETSTDFQPVPVNMTYQEAVHLLTSDNNDPQVAHEGNEKK